MARSVLVLVILGGLLSFVTPCFAQQPKPKMTQEQVILLNKANEALYANPADLKTAHESIRAALVAGEQFDILLLTLGRVLQKQDKCQAAKRAFSEINRAPREPSVDIEDIKRLRERYIEQMSELCSAELTLLCTSEQTQLEIGGKTPSCGSTIKLSRGGYQLTATLDEQVRSYDLTLEGAQTQTFTVSLTNTASADTTSTTLGAADVSDTAELGSQGEDESPREFRQKRAAMSGIATVALTGTAIGVWAFASRRQDDVFSGYVDDEGFWLDEVSDDTKSDLENEGNRWGRLEIGSGIAIPVFAVSGVLLTSFFAFSDARMTRSSQTRLQLIPLKDGAYSGVVWRW